MIQLALTIDVSGDDVAAVQPLQGVCRAYGIRATWFCDHAALQHPDFDRTLNSFHACGRAEVAALFDPRRCPPFYRDPREGDALALARDASHPPLPVVAEKLVALTGEIEDRTGVRPEAIRHTLSAADDWTPLLLRQGYRVDASALAGRCDCRMDERRPLLRVIPERSAARARWPRLRPLAGPLILNATVRDAAPLESLLQRLARRGLRGATLSELADAHGAGLPPAAATFDRDRLRWAA